MNLTLRQFLSMTMNLANNELHLQLEMPRLSKQGNPERGLVQNNFGATSVSHGDQSSPQHYYNGNVQVHNYSALLHDSHLNAFQTDQGYISFIRQKFLEFYLTVISFSIFACFASKFFIQLISQTARMSNDFPLVVVFARSTSRRFVNLKSNKIKL